MSNQNYKQPLDDWEAYRDALFNLYDPVWFQDQYQVSSPSSTVHWWEISEYLSTNTGRIAEGYIRGALPLHLIQISSMQLIDQGQLLHVALGEIRRFVITKLSNWAAIAEYDWSKKGFQKTCKNVIADAATDSTKYAILSHRWGPGELNIEDVRELSKVNAEAVAMLMRMPPTNHGPGSHKFKLLSTLINASAGNRNTTAVHMAPNHVNSRPEIIYALKHFIDSQACLTMGGPQDAGLLKLINFCFVAYNMHGYRYAWIDTCCIDKRSSAELDESIRSMFNWYRSSSICIVHLGNSRRPIRPTAFRDRPFAEIFNDPWFTRGWTLQELLAPTVVKFYYDAWISITTNPNDKIQQAFTPCPTTQNALIEQVSYITSIPLLEIIHFVPGMQNVRDRLRWASTRETTREEDKAYCLLGLLDVNMPITYGEGEKAFHRLQASIMEESGDRSLFIWDGIPSSKSSMLARGPECYACSNDVIEANFLYPEEIVDVIHDSLVEPIYMLTNYGLKISVSLYTEEFTKEWLFGPSVPYSRPEVSPDSPHTFRLAVLAYSTIMDFDGRKAPGLSYMPIVMLLIEERELNHHYYRKYPWKPSALPIREPPGFPTSIFIR
ncbi:Vegetative incompatibility protein HET-E-1 [Psilocybe cubensis]|uniref:Heterokaryon incompatibility domain-containing protein n=2 Tax=Psilocybe cubensis TaxID=181762 RepID=A0A8H8CJR9_PSICU|nr:Vegetative incompatibility protein HET-E-1 [Psilocybe cubensis]KAH9476773.1 Vegetative incompatibility protein HET-E-1 [Psilocybe cubensis]